MSAPDARADVPALRGRSECSDPPKHGCGQTGPTRNTSCGFKPNHNISIWRSPDLSSGSWAFVGQAVQCALTPDCGILYRPHLVFNPSTKLYSLFWNYVNKQGAYAGDAMATATHPSGPFTLATKLINTTFPTGATPLLPPLLLLLLLSLLTPPLRRLRRVY